MKRGKMVPLYFAIICLGEKGVLLPAHQEGADETVIHELMTSHGTLMHGQPWPMKCSIFHPLFQSVGLQWGPYIMTQLF